MPKKKNDLNFYIEQTKKAMLSLGVYRSEFDQAIEIYSKLLVEYNELKKIVTVEDMNARTNGVMTLENLRKDIAKYSDMLCLNPKVFTKTNIKPQASKSKLEKAMELIASG